MADFQIHVGKSRRFTLTPTLDGVPTPGSNTNAQFTTASTGILEITPLPAPSFEADIKLVANANAQVDWSYVNSDSQTITGSFVIQALEVAANGGTVTAGDEF